MSFKNSTVLFSLLAVLILFNSFFIVDEREKAIVLQFGETVREDVGVGFHFKIPIIQEVKKFTKLKVKKDKSSNKVIGVREIQKYLSNQHNLDTVKDLITIKTRQYAKRQITWARGNMLGWKKIDPLSLVSFLKKI